MFALKEIMNQSPIAVESEIELKHFISKFSFIYNLYHKFEQTFERLDF